MRHLVNCVYLGTFRESRDDCLSKDAETVQMGKDNILWRGNKSLKGTMIVRYTEFMIEGEEQGGGEGTRLHFAKIPTSNKFR